MGAVGETTDQKNQELPEKSSQVNYNAGSFHPRGWPQGMKARDRLNIRIQSIAHQEFAVAKNKNNIIDCAIDTEAMYTELSQ